MDRLSMILASKQEEVNKLNAQKEARSLKKRFSLPGFHVIAEIKRQSPTAALISPVLDPVSLAQSYIEGGASAISVLTDRRFFGGTLQDLEKIQQISPIPVLRKDFIIDRLQIEEAAKAGASAVLLIVAVLGSRLQEMLDVVQACGLEALVEVHDQHEIAIAAKAKAEIIGVNCRNLKTFELDPHLHRSLFPHLPADAIKVAESGIRTEEEAMQLRALGYNAILVGEAIVRSSNPVAFIRKLRAGP